MVAYNRTFSAVLRFFPAAAAVDEMPHLLRGDPPSWILAAEVHNLRLPKVAKIDKTPHLMRENPPRGFRLS